MLREVSGIRTTYNGILFRGLICFPFYLQKRQVPWKSIFSSGPVWAIVICHTLNNVGWYMILVELPLFLAVGMGMDIKEVRTLYEYYFQDFLFLLDFY